MVQDQADDYKDIIKVGSLNLVKLPYKKLNQGQTAVSCFTTGGRDNSGLRAESIRVKARPENKLKQDQGRLIK